MKSRLLYTLASLAMVALFVSGQAQSQEHHKYTIKVVPKAHNNNHAVDTALALKLYGVEAAFTATPGATNSDGSDLWPCFGDSSTAGPNVDCPSIGSPSVTFPSGGVVLGAPSYSWPLSACNQSTTADGPCGQTETWYEDDTNDSTDELHYSITATQKQGSPAAVVDLVDSGVVDFGPNVYGGLSPAADVIIYGDQGLGTEGVAAGPNNGNCSADYNYPLTSAAFPAAEGVYVISANKTCKDPVASATDGPVTFSAVTSIAAPKYTKTGTTAATTKDCTNYGVAAPCYTVTYTTKYTLTQTWTIWLY